MRHDLNRLLRPRSIAVMGSVWAENVIAQCRKMGFDGPVWPVHPAKAQIAGLPAFASLADLPQPPDATFIGVNRQAARSVLPAA
jgi:acyl-CoA synthetase (NDP forming)